ncbi:Peptidase family M3 containing protein [Dirofilaria immitis]|nr:Peptidase family M3 containing protein [Dirofilaria immitis]
MNPFVGASCSANDLPLPVIGTELNATLLYNMDITRTAWFGRALLKDVTVSEPSTSCGLFLFGSRRALSLSNAYRHAGYYALFPVVPNATPENNRFVANICNAEDWPALCIPPREMYEGTVRLLLEYGATIHEHMKLLEGIKPEDLTFENVIEPFIAEEEKVLSAFHTLWTRMITDWPISGELQADFMKTLCERNETADRWKRRLADFYYLQMKLTAMGEIAKKHEQFAGHDSFVEHYILKYRLVLQNSEDMENIQVTNRTVFKGAPPEVMEYEKGPWLVTATARSIKPILTYCSDKAIRAAVWDKWISRASKPHNLARATSNSRTIETIRRHQAKKAALLGFSTYAEYRLAYKMAESPKIVRKFTKAVSKQHALYCEVITSVKVQGHRDQDIYNATVFSLSRRMRPLFDDRMQAWSNFAAEKEKLYTLAPSDLYYICRTEAENLHEIDSLDLMFHFPFWPTFENMLEVFSYIFGILFQDITDSNLDRCHPDIRIFSDCIWVAFMSILLSDPISAVHGMLCSDEVDNCPENRWDKIVYLFANLSVSSYPDSSALLHYEELQNLLFHAGRALQFLLSQSPYRDLIVPWRIFHAHDMDAVDLLPTIVQFFVFKPVLLCALSSKHLKTGEALSETKANNVALALSRSAFYETYRALFWADFDLTLFDMKDTDQSVVCNFSVNMLALDIHDTFEKENDVCATGDRLKKQFCSRVQGRDPSPDAMCDFYDPPQYHISSIAASKDAIPYLASDARDDTEKLEAKGGLRQVIPQPYGSSPSNCKQSYFCE